MHFQLKIGKDLKRKLTTCLIYWNFNKKIEYLNRHNIKFKIME